GPVAVLQARDDAQSGGVGQIRLESGQGVAEVGDRLLVVRGRRVVLRSHIVSVSARVSAWDQRRRPRRAKTGAASHSAPAVARGTQFAEDTVSTMRPTKSASMIVSSQISSRAVERRLQLRALTAKTTRAGSSQARPATNMSSWVVWSSTRPMATSPTEMPAVRVVRSSTSGQASFVLA